MINKLSANGIVAEIVVAAHRARKTTRGVNAREIPDTRPIGHNPQIN